MLRLRDQRGLAMPMVIGMMVVFTVAVASVVVYGSGSQQAANAERKGGHLRGAAEAGLATAISVLATAADPTDPGALPACTTPTAFSVNGATGDYCGALAGMNWTITARGIPPALPAGASPEDYARMQTEVITQVASILPVNSGGLGQLWNRLYQFDTAKCVEIKKMILSVPLVSRSCVKLKGNSSNPSQLLGSYVSIAGDLELDGEDDSVGTAALPIERADIGGTCDLKHGSGPHTPCGPIDHVYAATATNVVTDLARPAVNFPYWYLNAKPGPMHPCTVGSLPAGSEFDKDTTYDGDAKKFDLTPNSSYTCQVWSVPPAGGELLGELSWNEPAGLLTIKGAIFFDGELVAKDKHGVTNYQGRGTIYTSKKVDIEEPLCAGGDGTHDCEADVTNWDPTQNTLVFITGGLEPVNKDTFTMNKDEAVFQGAVWSQGKCKLGKKASISAPLICGQLGIKEDDSIDDPTVTPWPASLIGSSSGQVYPNPTGDFQIMLREQIGG